MSEQELKIATWNLDRPKQSPTAKNKKKNESIIQTLRELDADILVLTETNSCIDLYDKYQTCFSTTCLFESLAIGREPYEQGENRVTIWSKFPGQRRIDMCNSHSSICALLNCNDWGELHVYGTVIGIYGKNRLYEPRVVPKTDFETAVEIQLIDWERLERLGNICIAGDFNLSIGNDVYVNVKAPQRSRVLDCFRELNITVPTKFEPENIDHIAKSMDNNVDHMAMSDSFLRNVDHEITTWNGGKKKDLNVSDHMGVCLTLRRPTQ